MIRGLIFDFDGLILDTEGPVHQSWVELFREFGAELPFDEWAKIIGTSDIEHFDPFDMLEKKIGGRLDRESLASRRYDRELELCYANPILPGVVEVIQVAGEMGLRLGVAGFPPTPLGPGDRVSLAREGRFDTLYLWRVGAQEASVHFVVEAGTSAPWVEDGASRRTLQPGHTLVVE